MDTRGCLGCDLLVGRVPLPGGRIYETKGWVVNHCLGPLGLGSLIVGSRRHVTRVSDLYESEITEIGPLLQQCATAVESLVQPEQVYVCLWAHGDEGPRHLHWLIQPVTAQLVARHSGRRSETLQAAMFETPEFPERAAVEEFCEHARAWFRRG